MAKKKQPVYVSCRYPKCTQLHDSNKVLKSEAFNNGKGRYYHEDCYHTMQTVNEIRDTFYKNINPTMTGKEIGTLVSTINHLIFKKNVDVDYLKFAVEYFIKYKPGKLNYPAGLHYIVNDSDVKKAWDQKREGEVKAEIKAKLDKQIKEIADTVADNFDLPIPEKKSAYKNDNRNRFSRILGT